MLAVPDLQPVIPESRRLIRDPLEENGEQSPVLTRAFTLLPFADTGRASQWVPALALLGRDDDGVER
ncbi:hypothetical protein A33O_11892 [Nitratireductor aquibiodomus RA22]|uniref:Uncharacterized protein n=1 Tax=Nitratireductor aquibiodomus RA22 TaxID=1189611 RepID=I5BXT5_9HYPH|nr:hypothetical protein A33O_11892 [Nitratireductor aquibiodomus RA22]